MNRVNYASPEVVNYGIAVPFSANGIVTGGAAAQVRGFGLKTIERTAVGVFLFTLDVHFNAILSVTWGELEAVPTLGAWKLTAKSNGGSSGPATIEMTHLADTGSAADPEAGDELYLDIQATQSPLASSTRCVFTDSV